MKQYPWQENLLLWHMEEQEGRIVIHMSGRRHGKSAILECIKRTGKLMEDEQDQSETCKNYREVAINGTD